MKTLDKEKLRARRIIATAALTAVTVAFLLLSARSARVGATPPVAAPSYRAADQQVPSDPLQAEQTAAAETPGELASLTLPLLLLDDVALSASPPPQPVVPPGWDSSPTARQQRLFKARRSLETFDARELLRQAR